MPTCLSPTPFMNRAHTQIAPTDEGVSQSFMVNDHACTEAENLGGQNEHNYIVITPQFMNAEPPHF